MFTTFRTAVIACLALSLSACATSGKQAQPDWLDGSSEQYPRTSYLIGHGQASELENAKDRARADIAKIFTLNVSSSTQDDSSAKFAGDGSAALISNEVRRQIQTSSEQVISGIEISDHWQNPQTRDYHVLAILPRHKARNSLTQDIRHLDQATSAYLQQIKSEDDALRRVGYQWLAINTQQQRAERQQTLRVIDLSGRGIDAEWNMAQLKTTLAELQQQSPIAIQSEDKTLHTTLAGSISNKGFVEAEDAIYQLHAKQRTADLGQRDGWYWLRATVEIELSDDNGNIRGKDQWQIKVSAQTKSEAQKRLQDRVNHTLNKELGDALLRFAAPSD